MTAVQKNTAAYLEKAKAAIAEGRADDAEDNIGEVLELDENDPTALALMAEVFLLRGDKQMAAGYYILAIRQAPDNLYYRQRFLDCSTLMRFAEPNREIEKIVLECLKSPDIDHTRAHMLWYSLLQADPVYAGIGAGRRGYDLKPLLSEYFIEGLRRLLVFKKPFEDFIVDLRRLILEEPSRKTLPAKDALRLADAIACYCHRAEYIMDAAPDEMARANVLKNEVDAGTRDPMKISLACCYFPPSALNDAAAALEVLSTMPAETEGLAGIIREDARIAEFRKRFAEGAGPSDQTSAEVRAQYEEFPYPRLHCLPVTKKDHLAPIERTLGTAPRILIAGCGTGFEALIRAVVFPQSTIDAIDLSSASLGYAAMKADQFGIRNINFMRRDILDLAGGPAVYDYVTSSGVLHHMKEPKSGWRALCDVLKPGGLMKLGLYSAIVHQPHADAKKIWTEHGFNGTRDSMKDFRRRAHELLPADVRGKLMEFGDYYSMSMYRDLLFHVQEEFIKIDELKRRIAEMGLIFAGFAKTPDVHNAYSAAYPKDPEGLNLDNWADFEEKNPKAFRGMYQFWCRKPAA